MNPSRPTPGIDTPPAPTVQVTPRRRRRWLVVAVVLAILALTIGIPFLLARSAPTYWQPPSASDARVVQAGEEFESRVVSETTAARPVDELWTLELTADQINAWLATRLPRWLANQGADRQDLEAVPHAMVHLGKGRVELAVQLRLKGIEQIVRLAYRPRDATGEPIDLDLEGVYAGRLRVPLDMLVTQIHNRIGGNDAQDAAEVIASLRQIEMKLKLEDGRTVVVTHAELHPGRAVFTCQTRLRR